MAQSQSERSRRYLAKVRPSRPVNIDDLGVTCWCEASIVSVSSADVKAGRTASCGLAGCAEEVAS